MAADPFQPLREAYARAQADLAVERSQAVKQLRQWAKEHPSLAEVFKRVEALHR